MKKLIIACLLFVFAHLSASDIAVLTLAIGKEYQEKVKLGIESKQKYCQTHGYDFLYSTQLQDLSRHIYWSKIVWVLMAMDHTNYKWIAWIDADTLIMNRGIQLEDLIDDRYDIIINNDRNGFNSGVFLVKNSEWSRNFFSRVYNRTDCLRHIFPEQQAMNLELIEKKEIGRHAKLVPQRFMNSYHNGFSNGSVSELYQTGDFILHFAGVHDVPMILLFKKYAPYSINDRSLHTLDHHLGMYGFKLSPQHSHINEGYMSDEQKEQFSRRLKANPQIQIIAEIGLNGGHSAENFFKSTPNLKKFLSFDINHHHYVNAAVEYFRRTYKERFQFIQGDSAITVAQFAKENPKTKCDLIYIDGNHTYEHCLRDIRSCKMLARPSTILWVDDYNAESVKKAIETATKEGLIKIVDLNESWGNFGERAWIELKYLFP